MRSQFTCLVITSILAIGLIGIAAAEEGDDVWDRVDHHFVQNDDVKIHYVTLGEGKPILFVHGFPDIWYSFRHQMHTLSSDYKTAAMDLRGYNQSDAPEGIDNYKFDKILTDVTAVIDDLGGKVTLVGHDWGGAIAWRYAMTHPEKLERLVILNLTHPRGYAAVIANPTAAQKNSTAYARTFASSKPDGGPVPAGILRIANKFGDEVADHYREALGRSSYDGMVNYYRANYDRVRGGPDTPNIEMSVLQIHGLKDRAVDKDGLKGTWDWIDNDYTLLTIPDAGHFVQTAAPELVTSTIQMWLKARD